MNDKSLGRFAEAAPGGLPGTDAQGALQRSMKHELSQGAPARLFRGVRSLAGGATDDLITTFFPGDCRICADPLVRSASLPLCEACLEALRPQAETHPSLLCPVCGEALGFESERFLAGRGIGEQVCTPCRRVPPAFIRAVAFGVYGGELRELIGLLKFEGLRAAAGPLGGLLAGVIVDLAPMLDPSAETLVAAVPLFRRKARERGFNQADLLAVRALRELGRSHPELRLRAAHGVLTRIKPTESQFGLNPRQRRHNLRGAFAVSDPVLVRDRDVLLVDDIYTTGATARACASVLRQAGARHVFVATLARAQTETVALWEAASPQLAGDRAHINLSKASNQRG